MTIEFRCTNCNKLLRTGDDKAGARAKCPDCGIAVTVPASVETLGDDFDGFEEFDSGFDSSSGLSESSRPPAMKNCRTCGAQIPANATGCSYCGDMTDRHEPSGGYHPRPTTTSGLAVASLVLGIIGLVTICLWFVTIPCSLLATIFGAVGIAQTKTGEVQGHGMAIAGLVCGIIALGLYLLIFVIIAAAMV